MRLWGSVVVGFAFALVSAVAPAQVPANFNPSYEVASIKPSEPTDPNMKLDFSEGHLKMENFPLIGLISFAYDIKSDALLENVPSWAQSQRYDINAKEEDEEARTLQKLPPEDRERQTQRMVQKLLQDRLHLQLTPVKKEVPVFLLQVAKGGLKMKKTEVASEATPLKDDDSEGKTRPGVLIRGRGDLVATDVDMTMFADVLTHMPEAADRVILDRTGMPDHFDFTLKWTQQGGPVFKGAPLVPNDMPSPAEPGGVSLFTALEEQLGLKLQSAKEVVTAYRVERLEKPEEN